ncbi:hypothetical protein EON77_03545, partial [bacterium]
MSATMPAPVPTPADGRPVSLGAMLRATVRRVPERVAEMIPGKEGFTNVTYTQMWETVRGWATTLEGLGLAKGDRMVLLGENSAEWAQLDWAAQCLGIIVVPIYPTLRPEETAHIATDCGARVALCSSADLAKKLSGLDGLHVELFRGEGAITPGTPYDEAALDARIDAVRSEDPCSFVYTSGTTGEPKGAILSHRAFIHVCV